MFQMNFIHRYWYEAPAHILTIWAVSITLFVFRAFKSPWAILIGIPISIFFYLFFKRREKDGKKRKFTAGMKYTTGAALLLLLLVLIQMPYPLPTRCDGLEYFEGRGPRHKCFTDLAVEKLDPLICRSAWDWSACVKDVAIAKQDKSVCFFYLLDPDDRNWCYEEFAVENLDESICEEIQVKRWKDICYSGIAYKKQQQQ